VATISRRGHKLAPRSGATGLTGPHLAQSRPQSATTSLQVAATGADRLSRCVSVFPSRFRATPATISRRGHKLTPRKEPTAHTQRRLGHIRRQGRPQPVARTRRPHSAPPWPHPATKSPPTGHNHGVQNAQSVEPERPSLERRASSAEPRARHPRAVSSDLPSQGPGNLPELAIFRVVVPGFSWSGRSNACTIRSTWPSR
jgi:hypothetical protein